MTPIDVALVGLFAALTAVGAYVAVPLPFSPVPVTLQTLFVYLSGLVLGGRRGAPSFRNYLVASLLATAAIYTMGVLQLMRITGIGLEKALLLGVAPFLPGDLAKILIAVGAAIRVRKALPYLRGI